MFSFSGVDQITMVTCVCCCASVCVLSTCVEDGVVGVFMAVSCGRAADQG